MFLKNSNKIKVSIVVPVMNCEKTISKTLDSLLAQNYENFEIIVVDDSSTDKTREIVKKFISKSKKIKLIENRKNLGPAATRNRGIRESRGEIIFFTDADCSVPQNWIERLLEEYNDKTIAGVGGYLKPKENNWIAKIELFQNKFLLGIKNKKIVGKSKVPMGYTNNVSYRKEVLDKVGGFDESFPFPAGEDVDLKRRVCNRGYYVVYLPLPVLHLEEYDLDYLLKRIITRGLNMRPPKSTFLKLILLFGAPVIIFNVLKKIIKYKKQGVM